MYPVEAAYSQWLHVATPCETWSMLALPRSLHQQVQHLASGYSKLAICSMDSDDGTPQPWPNALLAAIISLSS